MLIDFFGGGQLDLHEKNYASHLNLFFKKIEEPLWTILKYPCLPRIDSTNDQEATQSFVKNYIRNQVGISNSSHTYHIV